MPLWDWTFRAGLALAAVGLVWTVWPSSGERAYPYARRGAHAAYHHGPPVAIDVGHWNGAPADARLLGLADLLTWDGYRVSRTHQDIVPELLREARVLVIADPRPYPPALHAIAQATGWSARPAFDAAEVAAVRGWVWGGGSLLLAAGVPGAAQACSTLAAAFGLAFHECPESVFLREAAAGAYPATAGIVPEYTQVSTASVVEQAWIAAPSTAVALLTVPPDAPASCGPGQPLAVGLEFGRGRVVALSAQLEHNPDRMRRADNRQLLLNLMHWLSRAGN